MTSHTRRFGLSDRASHAQQHAIQDFGARAQAADAKIREEMLSRAGEQSGLLLLASESAFHCLAHHDGKVREAALYFLWDHWKLGDKLKDVVLHLSVEDPDQKVRERAISYLGTLYDRSQELGVAQTLARIVADDDQAAELRQKAYLSLRRVMKLNPYPHGLYVDIPRQVDWKLVKACIDREPFPVRHADLPIDERIERMWSPETATAISCFQKACDAFNSGRFDNAIRDYSDCLVLFSDSPGALFMRGCAYGNIGDLDAAIADFSAAIRLKANKAVYYRERAEAYRQKGMLDHSEADLRAASELQDRSNA